MTEANSKPTVRSLARSLGLSRTTVSDALRGSSRVDPATSRRVARAAQAVGYEFNPLISRMMSQIRRANGDTFHGSLAAIDIAEPGRMPHGIFQDELLAGAQRAARQLGFSLESFRLGREGYSRSRLQRILASRNVSGLLILPAWNPPDLSAFDWSEYSSVYTGRNLAQPALNFVTTDAFETILMVLRKLSALGYRRPGLYIEEGRDALNQHRLSAGLYAFHRMQPDVELVPALRVAEFRPEEFRDWFLTFRPDVVLHERTEVISWMEACRARIPETHGFVCLNALYCEQPCATVDQQPREIGGRAIELLTGQIQRNERGVPEWPIAVTVPPRWIHGPTLRDPK